MDINLFDFISSHKNDELQTILNELSSQIDSFGFQRILNRRNSNKYTLLHFAIFNRNTVAFKYLLQAGADANIKCCGTPCLHLIAHSLILPNQDIESWLENFISLLKVSEISSRDDQGFTILHLVCEFDLIDYAKAIREATNDEIFSVLLETKDRLGYRPIHRAAVGNSSLCLEFLFESSVVLSSITLAGETALHIAAIKKCSDAFNSIYSHIESTKNTDIANMKDRYDRTALDICTLDEWDPKVKSSGKKATAVISHDLCLKHSTCPPSKLECLNSIPPENSKRLHVLINETDGSLRSTDLDNDLIWLQSNKATISDVLRVHDWSYVKKIQHSCSQVSPNDESASGITHLDGDTAVSNLSFMAALHACGAICDGVDLVVKNQTKNVFCCVRPPGHHAGPRGVVKSSEDGPDSHGFCLLNNASIGS